MKIKVEVSMSRHIDIENLKDKIYRYLIDDSIKEVVELFQPISDGIELITQIIQLLSMSFSFAELIYACL